MELRIGGEITPRVKTVDENLTSVISWKFGYKKLTFAKKWFDSCAYVFELKNTLKWLRVEYSSGMGSVHSPTSRESIIHQSGPLLRRNGAKYENLGMQKMNIDIMEPFAEQRSEHHFSILQTCIPANKETGEAVRVRKEMYFENEQSRTRKEYICDEIHCGIPLRPRGVNYEK